MATKDGLTRDEAREAIGILALKEDNLENAAIVTSGALLVTISIFVTVIISIKYNLVSDLLTILVALLFVLVTLFFFRLREIDKKAIKLAKQYNLEEFYNAVLGKYK